MLSLGSPHIAIFTKDDVEDKANQACSQRDRQRGQRKEESSTLEPGKPKARYQEAEGFCEAEEGC